MSRIRDTLVDIAQSSGVEIRTSTAVKRVITSKDRAQGIELEDGHRESVDVLVINADVPYAKRVLLREKNRQVPEQRFSSGVVNLMLAVEDSCEQLAHHNIFLANDSAKSWDGLFKPGLHLPEDMNMYVHVPSKTDPSAAPPGCSSVMCLIPCGLLPGNEEKLLTRAKDQALDKLKDFLPLGSIKAEALYSPQLWHSRYNLEKGAAFGLSHNLSQLSLFRPPIQSSDCSNLFFVGASTRPGNGVPLVLISARLCAERIISELQKGEL